MKHVEQIHALLRQEGLTQGTPRQPTKRSAALATYRAITWPVAHGLLSST